MSKTAELCFVAHCFGGLVAMPDRLARWTTELGFFPSIHNSGLDPVLECVTLRRGQEVDRDGRQACT